MKKNTLFHLATRIAILLFLTSATLAGAKADRILLSPLGDTLDENSYKIEFAISPKRGLGDQNWLAYSTSSGIEMEFQRLHEGSGNRERYAFNLQYPLPSLQNYPAISIGVRDLLGTGTEHQSIYLAGTQSLRLSQRTYRLIRSMRVNVGAGTGSIGGIFVGVETRLASGFSLYAEVYRRRTNLGIAVPLARNLQAKTYLLDGALYYGISFRLTK